MMVTCPEVGSLRRVSFESTDWVVGKDTVASEYKGGRRTRRTQSPCRGGSTPLTGGVLHMTDILMRPLVRLQVKLAELREREDGQTTTEYAILLGFLAIAIIVALFFLRNVLRNLFSDAASSVSNAPG